MKKLMFAAAAVAMTSGAFAAPYVYDYKASVKHMYLKEVNVKIKARGITGNFKIYQKYQKSASLKGYLIQDMDGVTSNTIQTDLGKTPIATCADFGRSRGFLVVQNKSAEKTVRLPKCLPAVLDAKFLDTKYKNAEQSTSGLAEGYLFVGGDTVASVRPQIDELKAGLVDRTVSGVWDRVAPAAQTPGITAYADYAWTSIYLFGQFNGPNWYGEQFGAIPFPDFEAAWDANLPVALARTVDTTTGGVDIDGDGTLDVYNYYHDTWMNGAGIGKYTVPNKVVTGEVCCGLGKTTTFFKPILESLSGNLKAGIFICTENAIAASWPDQLQALVGTYDFFDGDLNRWEDQFVANRITNGTGLFANDRWQNDLWQDGAVDQATTDVAFGTWSIKLNKKFMKSVAQGGAMYTTKEIAALLKINELALKGLLMGVDPATITGVAQSEGLDYLVATICYCAYNLNKGMKIADGLIPEIYKLTPGVRFDTPLLTPQFCTYYGLNNWN